MINAKELMIGNIVEEADKKVPITIEAWHIQAIAGKPELANPIPLTEEILEKAGFVEFKTEIYDKGRLRIWRSLAYLKDEDKPQAYYIPNKVNHLHQLQNIYYSLTGQELELNSLSFESIL